MPNWSRVTLHDERRHRHRVELGQAAWRGARRTARRLQREREAQHRRRRRRISGAAGHPRAEGATPDDQRNPRSSPRADDRRRPSRRRRAGAPERERVAGDPVGLLDERDADPFRARDAPSRRPGPVRSPLHLLRDRGPARLWPIGEMQVGVAGHAECRLSPPVTQVMVAARPFDVSERKRVCWPIRTPHNGMFDGYRGTPDGVAADSCCGRDGPMVMTSIAGASHPRPKGATPLRGPLVPAFNGAPAEPHARPAACVSVLRPACAELDFVTVGTPDADGAPARSQGS